MYIHIYICIDVYIYIHILKPNSQRTNDSWLRKLGLRLGVWSLGLGVGVED